MKHLYSEIEDVFLENGRWIKVARLHASERISIQVSSMVNSKSSRKVLQWALFITNN